jgi:HSP20 family molecular chaperone IbpA
MWSEACEMLARAERLHREFFRPVPSTSRLAAWEPPVDILETKHEVLVLVALPGVSADRVEVAIEGDELVVAGVRLLPEELQSSVIHRLELPQGHFARRVRLPPGAYSSFRRAAADGCLLIGIERAREFGG